MKLRYQTATATFIQMAVMTLLLIIGGIMDVTKNCENSSECVTNSFLWIIIAFLFGGWYATLFAIGYFAQEKRSYKLARLLIAGELFTAFIALMLVKNPSSFYSGLGAIIALLFAAWVILLAWRIYKARGSRISSSSRSSSNRPRRRLSQ
jgi:uncharacterized membrane protein YqjE